MFWLRVAAAVLALGLAFSDSADTPSSSLRDERYVQGLTNGARFVRDRRMLTLADGSDAACVRAWAAQMAVDGRVRHSTCSYNGENVGGGTMSLNALWKQFWASDVHRSNLVKPAWRRTAIGVVQGADGRWWWCQTFYT